MRKQFKSIIGVVLSAMCVVSCVVTTGISASAETDSIISSMTLEQKIGQMITVDVRNWNDEGLTILEDDVANIISENNIGGVILFAENVEDTQQTVELTTALQNSALSSATKIPLFIGIDQEGGSVVRLKKGTSLPGNMALGAINNNADSESAGNILGSELSALGINVDYAPSLDVNSNPVNPIIGLRSFSSDPSIVSNLGVSMINGIQKNNVIASAKHFPGHGDTATDSHTSLPVVNKSLEQLWQCELLPFKSAVENGVDMIMTAHIQFPQVETGTVESALDGTQVVLPATLSKTFVTDILRTQLKYNGVVTTDAMNMSAISENFGVSQACILAINAGVDELLMPVSLTSVESGDELSSLINDIKSAVELGMVKEETINASVKRILDLKEKRGILNYTAPSVENAVKVVGSQANHETEDNISTKAITLLKNDNNVLPFKAKQNEKVVFVTAYSNETPGCEYAITKLISQKAVPSDTKYETYYYNDGDDTDTIINAIDTANYVVLMTEMNSMDDISTSSASTSVPRAILDYTKSKKIKCAVVSIGKPYDTANYTDAEALLVAYGCEGMDADDTDGSLPASYTYGPNIIASIEVIFGYKNPNGKLPVDVPMIQADGTMDLSKTAFKIGTGLFYGSTPQEPTTTQTDSTQPTQKPDNNNKKPIIDQLKDTGDLIPTAICIGGALIIIIILIAVVAKSGKKKSKKSKKNYDSLDDISDDDEPELDDDEISSNSDSKD